MSHYFTPDADLPHRPGTVSLTAEGRTLVFATDAGVFSRGQADFGTRLLLEALLTADPPVVGRVLDLGCGYGPLGLSLAALRPGVEAVLSDVNRRALALAEENARALGVAALVLESDGFAQVNGLFDHIITNPPIRAGKSVYYPWFDQAPGHLREGGSFWCVVQKKQGAPSALSALKASFGECRKAAGAAGYQVLHAVKRAAVR